MKLPGSLRVLHIFLMFISISLGVFLFIWLNQKNANEMNRIQAGFSYIVVSFCVLQIYYVCSYHIVPLFKKEVKR